MISTYFNSFRKLAASILSLKIWDRYLENISLFSFNILIGISSCGADFLVSRFLISFAITSLSTGTKENSVGFLKYCFILKTLGCLLYFFIAHYNGSVSSPVSQKMLSSFSMFNVFTMLPKSELKVSAIFASSVKSWPPSTSVILLFFDPFFSVKSGDPE